MALSVRSVKGFALPAALAALLAAPGCVDIVGADLNKYVERDEKHFTVSGKPDVALTTFDGSIEIRPWDKADVQVVIEKRGRDHDDVAADRGQGGAARQPRSRSPSPSRSAITAASTSTSTTARPG